MPPTIEPPEIILASASPRRAELLRQIGVEPLVAPAEIDEIFRQEETLQENLLRLALEKTFAVPDTKEALVIGADTVVVIEGEILGKPRDTTEATAMLEKLSGKAHEVYTGVAVRKTGKNPAERSTVEKTVVSFAELTSEEIKSYIATGESMDKAGAYGIQGRASSFIRGIRGDYFNVVGLPLFRMVGLVRELGYPDFPYRLFGVSL